VAWIPDNQLPTKKTHRCGNHQHVEFTAQSEQRLRLSAKPLTNLCHPLCHPHAKKWGRLLIIRDDLDPFDYIPT
jgi:hypothetical protein